MCHPFVCCNLVHTATCIACYLYGLTSIAITMDITVAGIAYLNTICSRRHCFKHTLYVCVHKCRCASHVVRRSLPVISRATVCAGTGCTTGARHVTSGNAKSGARGSVMSPPTPWLAACSRSVCVCVYLRVCACECACSKACKSAARNTCAVCNLHMQQHLVSSVGCVAANPWHCMCLK